MVIRDVTVVKRRDGRQKVNKGQERETGATGSSQRRSYSHVLIPP